MHPTVVENSEGGGRSLGYWKNYFTWGSWGCQKIYGGPLFLCFTFISFLWPNFHFFNSFVIDIILTNLNLIHQSNPGTSNTRPAGRMRPARGFDAAPKHLVRSRKHRKLGEKFIFFNLWYVNRLFSYFFSIFRRFVLIKKKSFQNSVNLWPLKQFYCIMRPSDSWSCLMRPVSLFEFETPDLT
jgi:hypothetical protein